MDIGPLNWLRLAPNGTRLNGAGVDTQNGGRCGEGRIRGDFSNRQEVLDKKEGYPALSPLANRPRFSDSPANGTILSPVWAKITVYDAIKSGLKA